jgi:hypothetical protein
LTQFNRIASVTVGELGAGGLRVSDLKITFDIRKDDDKDTNEAIVEIYNLSDKSRKRIEEIDALLFLSAGYTDGDGLETLFIGDITNISHSVISPNVVTRITADDGSKEILERKISLSHASGSSGSLILQKILNSFTISNNFESISFTDKKYANGFSFAGSSSAALDKVTKFLDLDWSIQNNEIKLVPFDGNDGTRVVSLSPETGLLESPEKELFADRKAKGKSKKKEIPGWRLKSLLQPKLVPGGKVIVSSKEIPQNSEFTIMTVFHTGDTHGNEWNTIAEVKE